MKFNRSISSLGLLFVAVGSIIGSGWLFGPMYAAQIAGPAAIISWILGGLLMLFIAFTFAELATTYPKSGGMVHFGNMSHGLVTSFTIGWMIWLSSVVVAPVETLALLQYAANYMPSLMNTTDGVRVLSATGIVIAAFVMMLMVFLNAMGAKFFSKSNNVIVLIKLIVPVLVLVTLFVLDFHVSNFTAQGGFAPYGWKGILTALPLGGIIFSYIGYSSAIQMAGEARNPQRALPLAVIGSVFLCMLLYVLIQVSFIGAMSPAFLSHGWAQLSFANDGGPFAGILATFGMMWLVVVIYADALISPFGTAYIFTAATARVTHALSEQGFFSKKLETLNKQGVPLKAMLLNYVLGLLLFLPFHAWQAMVEFLISCFVIAYSIGPISLYVLRRTDANATRPFKLPAYKLICLLAFYVCNLLLLWIGWATVQHLLVAALIGLIILLYKIMSGDRKQWGVEVKRSWWLAPYLIGVGVLSYLGSFGGGRNIMTFGIDFLVIAVFSVLIFWIAVRAPKK